MIPAAGERWRHRNGIVYVVVMLTNLPDDARYPLTVVYRNAVNGTTWSRPASDWARSFTPVDPLPGLS